MKLGQTLLSSLFSLTPSPLNHPSPFLFQSRRKHPMLSGLWREPFPGMKYAAIAFTFYCVGEWAWKKTKKLSHAPRTPVNYKFKEAEHAHIASKN